MSDQAKKLRTMVSERKNIEPIEPIKIYSVISGKGGVGKTNISINLAIKFQQMGKKVLILDADIGMSNANILLGIDVLPSLFSVLNGESNLEDIIMKGPEGVDLISGGVDLFFMEDLDDEKQTEIISSLKGLGDYDIIIIDNGAGISKQSLTFTSFAHEVILVATPEPTAIMDAYRVMKALSVYKLKEKLKIIINQVDSIDQGQEAYNKLLRVSEQFLSVELENIGFVFSDIRVNRSIMSQRPIVLEYPNALASQNIDQISKKLLQDREYNHNISNLKQLGSRLIRFFGR